MTVYEMVVGDLGIPAESQFTGQIQRIINHTQAVILRFLRRRDWPEELDTTLADASIAYFMRKYPEYASGSTNAAIEAPEIASITDNGQSVSYKSRSDSISSEAKAAGLDDVLGRYYGILVLYRRAWA